MVVADEKLARHAGAITLGGITAALAFVMFVSGRVEWKRRVRAHVYFHEVGGLRAGAAFIVAGRAVGHVESIAVVMHGTEGPLGGDVGVVVTVAIDEDAAARIHARTWPWREPLDPRHPPADVFVASRGVVSERYLELAAVPPDASPLCDGAKLLGADPETLDRGLQRTFDSMVAFRLFAAQLHPEVTALRTELRRLREQVDIPELAGLVRDISQLDELGHLRTGGNGVRHLFATASGFGNELRATVEQLAGRVALLRSAIDRTRGQLGIRGPELVAQLSTTLVTLRISIDKADALLAGIEALHMRIALGGGSLLKLLDDPEFSDDFKDLAKVLVRQPWKLVTTPAH